MIFKGDIFRLRILKFNIMYKIFCTLLILLITLPNEVESQSISKTFNLDGKINSNSGRVILVPIGGEIYYPNQKGTFETDVKNRQFTISKPCLYPYAFKIGLKLNSELVYISDIFWVNPGNQKITCNIDSIRAIPIINNLTMKELEGTFANSFKNTKLNSKGLDNDSILLKYTKANPNSFVSLWKLIDIFSHKGYKPLYDSIYTQFSAIIKSTYTGKMLEKKLKAASIVKIGAVFPALNLSDSKNLKVFTFFDRHNKFTFVDFWNSHCGPCIGQFDALKKLYSIYNEKGFSIVGISNDNKKSMGDWENIINKHQLPWEQFLDLNNKVCSSLSIYVFPTNFLLDRQGKIFAKDISINDLSTFLEMNLK